MAWICPARLERRARKPIPARRRRRREHDRHRHHRYGCHQARCLGSRSRGPRSAAALPACAQAAGSFSTPGILVAAATPTSFSLTHSECWATNVDHLDRDVVLVALVKAIELQEAALLVAALSAVLGKTGRASAEADARAISGRGELPLLVVLAAASQDAEVAVMATTVAVPCPAEPSVTLH